MNEPRFVSESYFMDFKFEPGNYYLAGKETLDGHEVLKIDYLPTKLFDDERVRARQGGQRTRRTHERVTKDSKDIEEARSRAREQAGQGATSSSWTSIGR